MDNCDYLVTIARCNNHNLGNFSVINFCNTRRESCAV